MALNIVYIHTHDTGRFISPYGRAVPTPRLQQLALDGVLFRRAFCAAPTCSPSRAALLNGNWPHENGMIGLVHRGARLNDPSQHLAHVLTQAGWESSLIGLQHFAPQEDLALLGYTAIPEVASNEASAVGPVAANWLRQRERGKPFFLSVGFSETHRPYPDVHPSDDERYLQVPPGFPDTADMRMDMAQLHTSLRRVDTAVGEVLDALVAAGYGNDTLVIFTTDHGLPLPDAKCNLDDAGTGVALIMWGPDGFSGGKVVDAIVSQLDLFPTIMQVAGLPEPEWLRGTSLLPLIKGTADRIHEEVFAEVTCHAAYEPMRSVRTDRWRFVRRFDRASGRVLANVDDSAAKRLFVANGWHRHTPPERALHDLLLDPEERTNLIDRPDCAATAYELETRLLAWMTETNDPLLEPDWSPPGHLRLDDRNILLRVDATMSPT
ncbi:MAG: sulfatase [Devosia sp.]